MTTAAASLHVPSLVDVLYTATRDRILTGELPAGSPLTEMEVATLYSVARPTAKAAMERLVYDGLLRRASNKTARVPEMGVDDIRDLYFSRGLLEREVMVELARRKHVPEAARRSLRAMREAGRDSAVIKVVGLDIEFHHALVEAVGSPRLDRLYRSLMGEVQLSMAQVRVTQPLSPSRIAREHSLVLKAIEAGDVDQVTAAINHHIEHACTRLIGGHLSNRESAASQAR